MTRDLYQVHMPRSFERSNTRIAIATLRPRHPPCSTGGRIPLPSCPLPKEVASGAFPSSLCHGYTAPSVDLLLHLVRMSPKRFKWRACRPLRSHSRRPTWWTRCGTVCPCPHPTARVAVISPSHSMLHAMVSGMMNPSSSGMRPRCSHPRPALPALSQCLNRRRFTRRVSQILLRVCTQWLEAKCLGTHGRGRFHIRAVVGCRYTRSPREQLWGTMKPSQSLTPPTLGCRVYAGPGSILSDIGLGAKRDLHLGSKAR